MDIIRCAIRIMNMFPYTPFLAKAIYKISGCMRAGPVQTRHGYWIIYKDTGKHSTAIRKIVISGSYERLYFNMISCLINPGDNIIDVGAYEGYVSLFMRKFVVGGG